MSADKRGVPGIDCLETSMYTHPFLPQPPREALEAFAGENPFCHFITASVAGGLHCSSLILVPERGAERFTLLGHLAKQNPQAAALYETESAMAVFHGLHGYVSPRAYEDAPDVPTWNYLAAQARGTVEIVDGIDDIEALLTETVNYMERNRPEPWTMDMAPELRVSRLLHGVLGFRLHVTKLEGTFKLSQNKSEGDRQRVAQQLKGSGCPMESGLGDLMLKDGPEP